MFFTQSYRREKVKVWSGSYMMESRKTPQFRTSSKNHVSINKTGTLSTSIFSVGPDCAAKFIDIYSGVWTSSIEKFGTMI